MKKEKPSISIDDESPLQREFDQFDINHIEWLDDNYIANALHEPMEKMNKLLYDDWQWRYEHGQNVVASIEGFQGKGKSMPFLSAAIVLGKIFKFPFQISDVYFSPEELDEALQASKPCQTFLRDEHLRAKAGIMSNLIEENLKDYEEQLRIRQNNLLYAGIELQEHAHFFCFEAKHIAFNKEKYPTQFIAILKTHRYTNRRELVWRGPISFPMPPKEMVLQYLERKNSHIDNLKKKYGNTLNPIPALAAQIVEKRSTDLSRKTSDGYLLPVKFESMQLLLAEEIGTRKFTNAGYKILSSKIKDLLSEKFEEQNKQTAAINMAIKEQVRAQRDEKTMAQKEELNARQTQKIELQKQKLAEIKRSNDLKERAILLKENTMIKIGQVLEKQKSEATK